MMVAAGILLGICMGIDEVIYSNAIRRYNEKYEQPCIDCKRSIEMEKKELEYEKKRIEENAKKQYEEYLKNSHCEETEYNRKMYIEREEKKKQMEQERRREQEKWIQEQKEKEKQLSIQFVESNLVGEVTSWLSKYFIHEIEAADRNSYVQTITAAFEFKVMENGIECQTELYDFYKNRWPQLEKALERRALSDALQSQIQTAILEYAQEYGGRDISVKTISCSEEFISETGNIVRTVMEYSEENENYQELRKW
jgi:hypothetical protein